MITTDTNTTKQNIERLWKLAECKEPAVSNLIPEIMSSEEADIWFKIAYIYRANNYREQVFTLICFFLAEAGEL